MHLKLVVIEAPAKRETLKKYLGQGYEVFATKGHIRDLPVKSFAIDINNNFEPHYENKPDKKELISELKHKADKAEEVLLATDPDREGEAIAWHIANVLNLDTNKKCRIQYNEISKNAVQKALKSPREIDLNLVNAQQARRVMDRIVGYKLSPIISKKVAPKLSAGRVQSVALKLVVDREKEIENFKPEEYWTVTAFHEKSKIAFKSTLQSYKNKKIKLENKDMVDEALKVIKNSDFIVESIKKSKTKSHAPAPFTTSTMQQDALNKLGMSLKKTTASAQELYEGVEVKGEGKIALITYIRTDSTRVSEEAQKACRDFIANKYGKNYLPEKPNIYVTKKNAQDAHEAIRPISMQITPEMVQDSLTKDNYRLYKLIYERFLASQMIEAEYSNVAVSIDAGGYNFKASGRTLEFAGYTAVYKEFVDEDKDKKQEISKLPALTEGEKLVVTDIKEEQKFTKPPVRYTEASLVKAMEEKGIGRPATYAATITILTARSYCEKEGKYLVPTELGRKITEYLEKFFSGVINVKFTAHMENRLDDIAENKDDWHDVVSSFWNGFKGLLEKADASSVTMKAEPIETDIICDKCGHKMLLREGRFGKFLGCSNFPKCRNIMPYNEKEEKKSVGICPNCGKKVYALKTKRGKTFYACEDREGCNFMSWDIPTGEKCPECGNYLIKKGKIVKCSKCSYVKPKEDNEA
ncbi:MAG TPA: type I DNA topoisomerase [Candidatus Caccovivens faecavium]|nr:type I DNA topoisomerase [Candidatus Caccovivens faecavium]